MSLKKKRFVISAVFILTLQSSICFAKFDDKGFAFFKWDNPAPRFADFGLDLENVRRVIGNGQLCISHKGRDIDLWTNVNGQGEIKHYKNVRFVTSMAIFNKSKPELFDRYMDFESYPRMMPQFKNGGIIKSQGNNYLVKLYQVYKMIVLNLAADFRYLYTVDENSNISILILDGDVGAGVSRLEFFPLSENRTLVVSTSWADLDSARFMFRTLIKAQPDVKPTAPLGAAAMLTEQFRSGITDFHQEQPKKGETLPTCPKTPIYSTSHIPVKTLHHLSDLGTVVFVHPKQWIKTEKGIKSVEFISSAVQMNGHIDKIKPYSSDFTRLSEYFDQAKKVSVKKQTNDYNVMDWDFKFGLGFVGVGVAYTTRSYWINDNTVIFTGTGGDLFPLHGAWEWIDLQDNTTLLVFTVANQIDDEASWVLKLGNRIPNVNIITSVFMGMLIVEKQVSWLENITATTCAMQ